jgi:tetratricopeptide (TPR) repeat protein
VPNALARTFGAVETPWSRLNVAQLLLSLGLPDLAVPILVEGVREAPGLAAPRVLLTKALLAMGEPARAEPVLATAEAIGGPAGIRVRTQTLRGDLAMSAGRTDDAIRAYDAALRRVSKEREPKTAAALLASRGMARLQASNLLPAFGDVLTLGWIEEARGRREEARRAFQRVEAMAGPTPETRDALERLAD